MFHYLEWCLTVLEAQLGNGGDVKIPLYRCHFTNFTFRYSNFFKICCHFTYETITCLSYSTASDSIFVSEMVVVW